MDEYGNPLCPECHEKCIIGLSIRDKMTGDWVCRECGLVLHKVYIHEDDLRKQYAPIRRDTKGEIVGTYIGYHKRMNPMNQ